MKNRWLALAGVMVPLAVGLPVAAADDVAAAVSLQDSFTKVAEKAFPAVVVITNKQVESRMPMYQGLPPEFQPFFGVPFSDEPDSEGVAPGPRGGRRAPRGHREAQPGRSVPQPAGKGSGVILRAEGYVLTNYHVVRDSDALEVKLQDGTVYDSGKDKDAVRVVGTDEDTDLAVLQIGGGKLKDLPTLALADSDQVKVGQWAIAVGAPFNLDYSVTVGVVSQKGRYDVNVNTYENYIQTDASINPGNSGGPLLNIRGEVIGINDFIVTGGMSGGSVGLGFAIASNLIRQVSASLIENGTVVRPWLGIAMQPLTDELKAQFGAKQDGVLVSQVMKGDPAEKAGIEAGDVIVTVNGKEVRTPHDVQFSVLAAKPGDKIKVEVDRRGDRKTLEIVARQKDATKDSVSAAPEGVSGDVLDQLGLGLEDTADGVVVGGVAMGSQAATAQLRRGDRVLEVNRQAVAKVSDVLAALRQGKGDVAVFYIERRNAKFFIPVPLPNRKE